MLAFEILQALSFAYLNDRTRFHTIPVRAVRWAITAVAVFVSYRMSVTALEATSFLDKAKGVSVGLGLTLSVVAVIGLQAHILHRYQRQTASRLYADWYIKVGAPLLPSVGSYSPWRKRWDRVRMLKNRLAIRWDGTRIVRVDIRGEGGKVSVDDARRFLDYIQSVSKAHPHEAFMLDFDRMPGGTISAVKMPVDDLRYIEFRDQLSVTSFLESSNIAESPGSATAFPSISFTDWNPKASPRFKEVSVDGLREKHLDRYDRDRLLAVWNKGFSAPHGYTWVLTNERSGEVTLRLVSNTDDEVLAPKMEQYLSNVAAMAYKKIDVGYGTCKVKDIATSQGVLVTFRLADLSHSRLLEQENQQTFIQSVVAVLAQQGHAGQWYVTNDLMATNSLLFHRPVESSD